MPTSFRTKILGVALIILIAAVLFGVTGALKTERAAEGFSLQSRALVVGRTSFSEAERMLSKYQRYRIKSTSCTSADCELAFRFRNSSLSRLRLAPPTGFDSVLRFHDGVLVNRETYLGQGLCCVVYVREDLSASATGALRSRFSPELQRDGSGRAWKAMVHLTPQASEQERELAYSFNLHCLDKIGGCKTAEELSPGVWQGGGKKPL